MRDIQPGQGVSIRAPAWGATGALFVLSPSIWCFNPRPRVGGDEGQYKRNIEGARFNPRPRVGGD